MSSLAAFYAGSFDPVTNGHVDVLSGALRMAARVVVAVGVHPGKKPLFEAGDRISFLRAVVGAHMPDAAGRVEVVRFSGLAVDAAWQHGATLIVRGIRDGTDLDYEMQMAGMNATMAPDLRTVFVPASPSVRMITGTLVRQIAGMGGDVRPFVPALVADALEARFAKDSPKETS